MVEVRLQGDVLELRRDIPDKTNQVSTLMGNGWGASWMWFMWPMMLVALVAMVVFLGRGKSNSTSSHGEDVSRSTRDSGPGRAQEILADRYARGEISDDEYRDRLRHLRAD